jgi:histidine triad (HIT) family protein
VVPRAHHPDVAALAAADPAVLAELVLVARQVATAEGHDDYRLVFNTGAGAGQSVFHVHGHVLAGRPLSWPPG